MIDVSDGLSTDVGHICKASGVGAKLFAEKIPAVRVPDGLWWRGLDRLKLALHSGDDYELLFTVPQRLAGQLPGDHRGVPLTVIGEITRDKRMVLIGSDARPETLRPAGWDPPPALRC